MRRRWILAFALAVVAAPARAAPDDSVPGDAPNVEFPLGAYVRPGRPLDLRIAGGADKVQADGTPWALPQGERGDEFILQIPAAVSGQFEITVLRGRAPTRVGLPVTVLPADGVVVGLLGDSEAPEGATGVRIGPAGLPSVGSAWMIFDDVIGERGSLPPSIVRNIKPGVERGTFHDPIAAPPDPEAFAATAEASAVTPLLPMDIGNALLLLAATELLLVLILRLRRDGPWVRMVWLSAPAVAAGVFVGLTASHGAALRAVPLALEDETAKVVFVRIEALRDGEGTLRLPESTLPGTAAAVRFSSDDPTVEGMHVGPEIRVLLKAGEVRVVAYRCGTKGRYLIPFTRPADLEPGPVLTRWLRGFKVAAHSALAGVHPNSMPSGRGIDVLPGVEVSVEPVAPAK